MSATDPSGQPGTADVTVDVRWARPRIVQARGALQQAMDELEARSEANRKTPGTIAEREVEQMRVLVETQQGALDAALASRQAIVSEIQLQLPAQKASAEAALHEAQVDLGKTLVAAGTNGIMQQFALRPGDVVNPMLRPASILVPERKFAGLMADFGQIEAQVLKVGMIGEVCVVSAWPAPIPLR